MRNIKQYKMQYKRKVYIINFVEQQYIFYLIKCNFLREHNDNYLFATIQDISGLYSEKIVFSITDVIKLSSKKTEVLNIMRNEAVEVLKKAGNK